MSFALPLLAILLVAAALRAARMPVVAVVIVAVLGGGAYAITGMPGLPSQPVAAPTPPPGNAARQAEAQTALLSDPGNVAAWAQFSDSLIAEGRSLEAVEGLRLAVHAMPQSADLWVQLGSALMSHGDGVITPAARLAFGRASALQPEHPAPPYFLGLAYLQAGEPDQALAVWRDLEQRTPQGAPWRADLQERIGAAERMGAAMATTTE
ncbi:tetratricopeptide repeat protein [Pacificimonas sp. ICDLI1SI03]